MNKLNSYISIIIGIFIIGFFCLIVFVSLLGDNHKINFAVEQYLTDIQNRTFNTPCETLLQKSPAKEDCRNRFFLLETALLIKYDLIGAKDYSIDIKRDHFRIPFFTDDTVSVSIAFTPKKENFLKTFFDQDKPEFVEGLMTVKKDKMWRVQTINFEAKSIKPILDRLTKELDLNTYITKTEKGYKLNNVEVDFENLSPLKKRLFEYSLQKLSTQK